MSNVNLKCQWTLQLRAACQMSVDSSASCAQKMFSIRRCEKVHGQPRAFHGLLTAADGLLKMSTNGHQPMA